MTIDTVVAWTAFIAIVFLIYVMPKANNIRKAAKQKQNTKTKKTKKKLPPPAPLLGVVYPSTEKPRQRKRPNK